MNQNSEPTSKQVETDSQKNFSSKTSATNTTPLSTESYKGVRDFYPQEMVLQNHIFNTWRKVVESYGYEEYNASVLEPAELYRAKSGDEIVNTQTYTFTDRGEREVTLRPEMTPTVARMVAARRRELAYPLRWYSIPNLFRYEKPQRGRLREFWQLNVDIFGVKSVQADVELMAIAHDIMLAFGLKDSDFEIRINNRKIINYVLNDLLSLNEQTAHNLGKLIDKKDKMTVDEFKTKVHEILPQENGEIANKFLTILNSKNFEEFVSHIGTTDESKEGIEEVRTALSSLEALGITNAVFDQSIMRGFDYYTGMVFEVYDKHPDNRRAVFGGGRYDNLLGAFSGSNSENDTPVTGTGFGMGDAPIQNALESYGLIPKNKKHPDLYICVMPDLNDFGFAQDIAEKVRTEMSKENAQGTRLSAAVDYSGKKIGDQIKTADRKGALCITVIGENEKANGKFIIKELSSGKEVPATEDTIAQVLNDIKLGKL